MLMVDTDPLEVERSLFAKRSDPQSGDSANTAYNGAR